MATRQPRRWLAGPDRSWTRVDGHGFIWTHYYPHGWQLILFGGLISIGRGGSRVRLPWFEASVFYAKTFEVPDPHIDVSLGRFTGRWPKQPALIRERMELVEKYGSWEPRSPR